MTPDQALSLLLEGNARFRSGAGTHFTYESADFEELAQGQEPLAAVVACADSRVEPGAIFDQPLGTLFTCRVPGNVASESARWVVDMAVGEFEVPIVMVMGHTGCLAVTRVLEGKATGMGGLLKLEIQSAIYRAQAARPADPVHAAIEANARMASEALESACENLRKAVRDGRTRCLSAVYEMRTGEVRTLA